MDDQQEATEIVSAALEGEGSDAPPEDTLADPQDAPKGTLEDACACLSETEGGEA